jgi:hypothetical protein
MAAIRGRSRAANCAGRHIRADPGTWLRRVGQARGCPGRRGSRCPSSAVPRGGHRGGRGDRDPASVRRALTQVLNPCHRNPSHRNPTPPETPDTPKPLTPEIPDTRNPCHRDPAPPGNPGPAGYPAISVPWHMPGFEWISSAIRLQTHANAAQSPEAAGCQGPPSHRWQLVTIFAPRSLHDPPYARASPPGRALMPAVGHRHEVGHGGRWQW